MPLFIQCDANAQNTLQGSSYVNERGDALLEVLSSVDLLDIANRGCEPTSIVAYRREMLNLA